MRNLIKKIFVSNVGTNFILLKAILFLVMGIIGIIFMLVFGEFNIFFAILLVITLWAWCRVYYFCFYIIHKFFDPEYKFNGLFHFILYLIGLEKKVRGASIEEAALHILRRRGYKINTEDNIISKGQDKTDSPKQRKSKLFWDDDIKK